MAKRTLTVTKWTCDLTGEDVAEKDVLREHFIVGGELFEIDLGPNGAATFYQLSLGQLMEKARRLGPVSLDRLKAKSARTALDREQTAAIREWAREQGLTVSEKGRIPAGVLERYQREH